MIYYKKHLILMIISLVLIPGIALGGDTGTDEEYIMGDIDTLPANFPLTVAVSTNNGGTYVTGAATIKGVCTFKVEGADAQKLYDISVFRDGVFLKLYQKRSLPFTLKRNYRGIRGGVYRITFVARDDSGLTGKGEVTLTVTH